MSSLFVDLLHLSEGVTDGALEYIYKAVAHDHDGDGIWKPHESPLIQRLIELFTQRGLDRLSSVKQEIEAWMQGHRHVPSVTPPPKPPGTMHRWTGEEMALARIYLEAIPPALWSLEDHMLAVDMVVQQYMPPGMLHAEAEWLATRASLMGKVQANLEAAGKPLPTLKQADEMLKDMPSTVAQAVQQFALGPAATAMLQFSAMRSAENVRALADDTRHRMRSVVLQHLEEQATSGPRGPDLRSKLFDQFGTLNRDWRRIAVTEAGEAMLQGLIASLPFGTQVKRVEQYRGACAFCRSIDGKVATVVDPAAKEKDSATEVWVGKNNIGRSASPKKRVGDVLVPRDAAEMWHLPAGLAHPHCRGRWIVLEGPKPGDDPGFAAWLAKHLS